MSETKAEKKRAKFAREYGSKERVEFIGGQFCVGCGYIGVTPQDNHHTSGDGTARKGPHTSIVPLCRKHWDWLDNRFVPGCHTLVHNEGQQTFRERRNITQTWAELAEETEAKWLEHLEGI